MNRKYSIVMIPFIVLLLADSAFSTKMKSFWRNPSATAASMQCTNVLILASIKQPLTRKVAEDKAVRIIAAGGKAKATPSYTFLSETEVDDKEIAKSKISEMGFDGVLIMQYATSADAGKYTATERDAWIPVYDLWSYYGYGWGRIYDDPNRVRIETLFYSLKDNQLVWAGITESKNPKNAATVVGDIAEEISKYLQKEGLIAGKK